jgi:hypothetical protein
MVVADIAKNTFTSLCQRFVRYELDRRVAWSLRRGALETVQEI